MERIRKNLSWPPVIERAVFIANSFSTRITLRQLFYRLVSQGEIPNSETAYKTLSRLTGVARREGTFPELIDLTREITRYETWTSPKEAIESAVVNYRRDRTEGQSHMLVLGVEKRGLRAELMEWFGSALGIPIVALSGYDSQAHVTEVVEAVRNDGRPAVLIYAGDFDPSGEDILRDFLKRTDCWSEVIHVGLTAEQVAVFGLPTNPGKETDPRSEAFEAKHGRLVQVELDALSPDQLQRLYAMAIARFWDDSTYEAVLDREAEDYTVLHRIAEGMES